MDYLMYVEYNAECLQFLLWYCGFVERWSKLPKKEKDLAPMWRDSKVDTMKPKHTRNRSLAEKTERFNRILAILEKSPKHDSATAPKPVARKSQRNDSMSTNFSWPRALSADMRHWDGEESKSESSQSPAQPFRDEIFRVVRHYISTGGPRQLNLTHQARTMCIQAVEHTTHPSALLPAFAAAEAMLRGQCHPNFVRWSLSNSNRPRVVFMRGLAVTLILLGFMLDILLIMSSVNQWMRMLLAPLWILGITFLITSREGVCIILHWNYKRNLRPWEQFADDALKEGPGSGEKGGDRPSLGNPGHQRKDTDSSSTSNDGIQPLRERNLHSLGPANTFDAEPWVGQYHGKPGLKRIFEVSVTTENRHVRAMRDRIVFRAVLWASLIALVLAICSVLVPSTMLF